MTTGPERSRPGNAPRAAARAASPSPRPGRLGFASTAEVEPLLGTIGQPRALDSLEFGLAIGRTGSISSSRVPRIRPADHGPRLLRASRADEAHAVDWVYVYDFANPDKPNAIADAGRPRTEFAEGWTRSSRRRAGRSRARSRARSTTGGSGDHRRDRRPTREREEELTRFAAERGIAIKPTLDRVMHRYRSSTASQSPARNSSNCPRSSGSDHEGQGRSRGASGRHIRQVHQLEKEANAASQELDHEVALFATGRSSGSSRTLPEQPRCSHTSRT